MVVNETDNFPEVAIAWECGTRKIENVEELKVFIIDYARWKTLNNEKIGFIDALNEVLDNAKYENENTFSREGVKVFGIGRTYENCNYTLRQALTACDIIVHHN